MQLLGDLASQAQGRRRNPAWCPGVVHGGAVGMLPSAIRRVLVAHLLAQRVTALAGATARQTGADHPETNVRCGRSGEPPTTRGA